ACRIVVADAHDAVGLAISERFEENGVNHRKDRSVGADAEREHYHGQHGESSVLSEGADREHDIHDGQVGNGHAKVKRFILLGRRTEGCPLLGSLFYLRASACICGRKKDFFGRRYTQMHADKTTTTACSSLTRCRYAPAPREPRGRLTLRA